MTPTIETYPVLIGLVAAVALLLVYSALDRFVFQILREQIFQRERSKTISKALREGKTSIAWDTANIDLQLDKLSEGTRYATRMAAITHIRTVLKQSNQKLTRKQAIELCEKLPLQNHQKVRYEAAQLLCENIDALLDDDLDSGDQATEPDPEKLYRAWKRALMIWGLELLVGIVAVFTLLDQLPIQGVVSLAMIGFVIAVIPLFGLASGTRLLFWALVVLAIVAGALWLYADVTHTGRDSVSAELGI